MDNEFLQEILSQMVKSGKASWLPPTKTSSSSSSSSSSPSSASTAALIYWRKPEEWAQMVYKFVEGIGGVGSIYTVYDLFDGDDSIREGKICFDFIIQSLLISHGI